MFDLFPHRIAESYVTDRLRDASRAALVRRAGAGRPSWRVRVAT